MSEETSLPPEGSAESIPDGMKVQVVFRVPQRMPSVYAHHLTIQKTEHEYLLSFFEVIPPIVAPDDEEFQAALRARGIEAQCVARITVSKPRYAEFVKVITELARQEAEAAAGATS